jgi:methionyl aminopeptidase
MTMNKLLPPLLSPRLRNISAFVCRDYLKRHVTTSPAFDSDKSREVEDFGTYNVILPEEPFVWGVSHITQRPVPSHIVRPKYAVQHDPSMSSETDHEQQYEGDGRITLGSIEEKRMRAAATLAKNVRQYAGSLVQVRFINVHDADAR